MSMSVNTLLLRSLQIAGRADKPTSDTLAQALVSLNTLLASWRLRGVDLFNLHDQQYPISPENYILNDGATYVCIRPHYSTTSDEPGTGANWQNFWALTTNVTSTVAWAAGTSYTSPNRVFLTAGAEGMPEVANPRILKAGAVTDIDIVGRQEFEDLDPAELGIPTKIFIAPGPQTEFFFWPTPDYSDLILLFTAVVVAQTQYAGTDAYVPDTWLQALQYGLAAELGYYFNLTPDRLAVLNNKAEVEFRRALGSDKGVVESCHVDPCY